MELDKIERLINKYFEATTTVAEENVLKQYFSKEKVAPHLEQYTPIFNYMSVAKKEGFTKAVVLPVSKAKDNGNYLKWISVAAVAVLMIGFYFYTPVQEPVTLADEFTPEEIASAQEALVLLAMNFNKGTEKLTYLQEFEKNTNKFLIKE